METTTSLYQPENDMALALTISSDSLHSSLRASLASIAQTSPNLDDAEKQLRAVATAHFWRVTRGGHHVALNYGSIYGEWTRVAMIAERS